MPGRMSLHTEGVTAKGETAVGETARPRTPWSAPTVDGPVTAVIELPGSKSLTNRALVLAALSTTPTRISAPLRARDTLLMAAALRSLGVDLQDDGTDWMVRPAALHGGSVDCGLAGTVMRFVPPLAALAVGDSHFDGDPAARTRPMSTLIDGLRQAGAVISDRGRGVLPFTVHGAGSLPGGRVQIDAAASSQFVSALLLAGPRFDKGLELVHDGPGLPSLPHIEMTVAALREAGASIDTGDPEPLAGRPRRAGPHRPRHRAGPVQRRAVPGGGAGDRRLGDGATVAGRDQPARRAAGRAAHLDGGRGGADDAGLTVTGAGVIGR